MAENNEEGASPQAIRPSLKKPASLHRWILLGAFAFFVLAAFELNTGPALVALPPGHMRPPRPPLDLIVEPVPALVTTEALAPPRAQQELQDRLYRIADGYEIPADEAESEDEWRRINSQVQAAQDWCAEKLSARFGTTDSAYATLAEARAGSSVALEEVVQMLEFRDNATTSRDRLRRGECAAWVYAGLDLSGRFWVLNIDLILHSPEPIITGTANFEADHETVVQIFQSPADCEDQRVRWPGTMEPSRRGSALIAQVLLDAEEPEPGYQWFVWQSECRPVTPYHLLH